MKNRHGWQNITRTANLNGENVEEEGQDDDLPFEYSSMLRQTICLKIKNYSLMYEQEFYLQEIK